MHITQVNVVFNKYINIYIKNSKAKNNKLKLYKCNINCYNSLRCINCINIIISNYNNNNYILIDKLRDECYSVLKNTINFEIEYKNNYNYLNNYNSSDYHINNNIHYNTHQINDQNMINNNCYYNNFNNNNYNNNFYQCCDNYNNYESNQENLILNTYFEKNNLICNNTNFVDVKINENLSNDEISEETEINQNDENENDEISEKTEINENDSILEKTEINDDNSEKTDSNENDSILEKTDSNKDNNLKKSDSNDQLENNKINESNQDNLKKSDSNDQLENNKINEGNQDNFKKSDSDDQLENNKINESKDILEKTESNEDECKSIDLHISKELRERKKLVLCQLKKRIKDKNKKIKNKLKNKNKKNKKINNKILKNNDMILINNTINENKDELLLKVKELYPYDFYYLKDYNYNDLKNYIIKNPIKKNIVTDIIDEYKDCLITIYLSYIVEKNDFEEHKKLLKNCTIVDVFTLFQNIGLNRLIIEKIITEKFYLQYYLDVNNPFYIDIDKEFLNNLFLNLKKNNITLFIFNDIIKNFDKLFIFEDFIFDTKNFNGDFYFLEILDSEIINNFLKECIIKTIKMQIKQLVYNKINIKNYLQQLKNKKNKIYSEILFINFNYIKDNKFKFCKAGYYNDGNKKDKIYYQNTSSFVAHLLSSSSKLIV